MKTTSLWIIRVALTVQFLGVLAVPTLVAAADSPRAMWMADWLRPQTERTFGVLRIRDGKLSFVEQLGQVDWELDLSNVKSVATTNGDPSTSLRASRSLLIVSVTGEEYVVSILEANMTQASPKRAAAIIERAIESAATNSR